jgi:hypothetical protein
VTDGAQCSVCRELKGIGAIERAMSKYCDCVIQKRETYLTHFLP